VVPPGRGEEERGRVVTGIDQIHTPLAETVRIELGGESPGGGRGVTIDLVAHVGEQRVDQLHVEQSGAERPHGE
jgi:hypothetical protein